MLEINYQINLYFLFVYCYYKMCFNSKMLEECVFWWVLSFLLPSPQSLSDFLEVDDNGCENFSELRACSIFAKSSSVICLVLFDISSWTCCDSKFGLFNIVVWFKDSGVLFTKFCLIVDRACIDPLMKEMKETQQIHLWLTRLVFDSGLIWNGFI